MSPLCVFLCRDEIQFKNLLNLTSDAIYHRCFVLSSREIDRRKFNTKDTDNFVSYDYNLDDLESLTRLLTCYSHPMYSHILIFMNDNIDFATNKKIFKDKEFFINTDCLGFTRQYVALNGFHFKKIETLPQDPLEFVNNIRKALNGEVVTEKYFIEALKELLPAVTYEFNDTSRNLPEVYKNIIKSIERPSQVPYKIYYKSVPEIKQNSIVFIHEDLDLYKYVIKQENGLNCYIF